MPTRMQKYISWHGATNEGGEPNVEAMGLLIKKNEKTNTDCALAQLGNDNLKLGD